jgi:diguanylate cyclase (GGDEF)-like protein/PAS domain S-box-containing protein
MDVTTFATLDARSRLLRGLLDASREGLLAADARDGRILLANVAACALLATGEDRLLGEPVTSLPLWPADWSLRSLHETGREHAGERVCLATAPNGNPLEIRARRLAIEQTELLLIALNDPGERLRAETALRESEARFRGILEQLPAISVQGYDEERRVTFWNDANERIYGYRREEAMGRRLEDLIIPEPMREVVVAAVMDWLERDLPIPAGELTLRRKNGSPVTVFSSHVMQCNSAGRKEMFCVDLDLSDIRAAEERLRLTATVFDSTAEGIYLTDARSRILEVNRACLELTGYPREALVGQSLSRFKSGRHRPAFFQAIRRSLTETGQWRGEISIRFRDRSLHPILLQITQVANEQGQTTHYIGVFSDLSQAKHTQDRLDFLTHHDALTGLPNRLLFGSRLEHAIRRAARDRDQLAVLFVNLDRFKGINDSLGHPGGDRLLRAVAERLRERVRRDDTVARFGGDELTLILENVRDDAGAGRVAETLLRAIAQPFPIGERDLFITASIGVALYPRDGENSATLLSNAGFALRQAKKAGGNGYAFYSNELTKVVQHRAMLENGLRRAVQGGELRLHYQPQIRLDTGEMIGLEALIRWEHPELGFLLPGHFIEIAEEGGSLAAIGEWALYSACTQARQWLDAGIAFGRVYVNIAHSQIHRGDLHRVTQRILAETGLPAGYLGLEITEGVAMERGASQIIEELERLKADGISLAIDDFGTGYSSLSRLKQLPVDQLKIDRSFVRDIGTSRRDLDIVRAIITLGATLGLEVLAEGIETQDQGALLLAEGCRFGQGYFYARPMPPADLPGWMRGRAQAGFPAMVGHNSPM